MADIINHNVNGAIRIDEDGNVDLEVTSQDGKRLLRVWSKVLCLASPVFKKLFHSGLRDAQMVQSRCQRISERFCRLCVVSFISTLRERRRS
jgi:hypothetical protein